jgi:hypothetical protein
MNHSISTRNPKENWRRSYEMRSLVFTGFRVKFYAAPVVHFDRARNDISILVCAASIFFQK